MSQLKSEAKRAERYRNLLRHGKKDNSMTEAEIKHSEKLRKQSQKKARAEVTAAGVTSAVVHDKVEEHQDDNVGAQALNRGTQLAEDAYREAHELHRSRKNKSSNEKAAADQAEVEVKGAEGEVSSGSNPYTSKLRDSPRKAEAEPTKKQQQKRQGEVYRKSHGGTKAGEKAGKETAKEAKDFTEKIAEFVAEHGKAVLVVLLVLLLILLIMSVMSSCSMCFEGLGNITIGTSYVAEDSDIKQVEQDYKDLEDDIRDQISHIERDYPGYDEYNYELDEIGHNPWLLAAILTVVYEDYKRDEVQDYLKELLEKQYELELEEVVETRTRTETVEEEVDGEIVETVVEVEYEYYILNVTLTNKTLEVVAQELEISDDDMLRMWVIFDCKGNKPYLFDDIYSNPTEGDYGDYRVPGEFLTDEQFGRMLHEAEKHLNKPYVWGGYDPDTGFDCSGFVSWVINHCGNGWNVGRQTANGLKNITARISESEVRPGDLIFFKGTYATSGASHVGIVVDPVNKIMIHAGNPIKYASYDTSYFRSHFYCYGRIN